MEKDSQACDVVPPGLDDEEETASCAGDVAEEKVSIEQILAGMKNEFNRKVNATSNQSRPDGQAVKSVNRASTAAQDASDACGREARKHDETTRERAESSSSLAKKVQQDEAAESPAKHDGNAKKDNNIPRIVLTFRTIDENTDYGRKTKISSCSSNLSLVPDELIGNCDRIGGVSVKIEHSDENSTDGADKSDNEDSKNDDDAKNDEKKGDESAKILTTAKEKSCEREEEANVTIGAEPAEEEPSEKKDEGDELANDEADAEMTAEPGKQADPEPPVTRKRRAGRTRLRVLSDSAEESPGPKRSARRLCKEPFRSTVLESAMARKEKSNYTQETSQWKRKAKPGRPKKVAREQPAKQVPVKSSTTEVRNEIIVANGDASNSDVNASLENSRLASSPEASNANETSVEESRDLNPAIGDYDGMPILSPMSKTSTEQSALPAQTRVAPAESGPNSLVGNDESSSSDVDKPFLKPAAGRTRRERGRPRSVQAARKIAKTDSFEVSGTLILKESELCTTEMVYESAGKTHSSHPGHYVAPVMTDASAVGQIATNFIPLSENEKEHNQKLNIQTPHAHANQIKYRLPRSSGNEGPPFCSSDGSPSIAETGKNNDFPEECAVPAKRTRRSMAPSPSPAEGQASKPESTAIFSESYEQTMKCLCQVRSQLYVTITGSGAPLYCTAIDSIDNRLIGCCNEVDSNDVAMRRPSTCVPFIILCRTHKERLLRHNCCPSCGLFCTQGKFVQCSNGHQFHRECETVVNKKSACPHCATESAIYDIQVTMNGERKPVYIPTRRKFSKLPSAKMSLPGKGDNTKLAERPPSPLVSPEDIKIPEAASNPDRPERYTIMSLYTSVKNGDLEKLVNVLACGYNANHTFREQSHRTGLHIAAEKGHLGCVHVLIQAGAQVDVMDKNQLTPLMLAATEGKTDVVKYLVRTGADVTLKGEDGMTALHMAAKSGHLDACRIILSECKVPRTLVDSVDDGGWTSLIWACEFCHTNVARFLLEKKCDPLIRDAEQNIALHWSAYSGSSEITEMLLNEGCDVNAVNVHGDTPLHIAARQDQYAVSVLLLARGAKVVEVNAAGETAVNCCINDGDTMAALRLNAKVNELSEHMWEKTTRILTNDVSRGKETNPIQCVNGYDTEDKPTDFLYVTDNCFTSNINVDRTITSLQSCHCEDNCNSEKCLCGNISLRCWYDEDGKLIPEFNYTDPPMLFECNQACDCNRITCNNRVVQHGLTQRFQLFRTKGKGWGLRTLRRIPKGTYVCEYVGEIISDSEADHREDDSYLFDLDNRDGETYCIDARRYGNLARFINHSCAPNLLPVRVFVEHQDLHFPRIAFFANRDIDADEELGFDYGEKFWIIKCKSFTCTCGAENCRYSEKTIQVTLDNYRKKIQQEEILAAQML